MGYRNAAQDNQTKLLDEVTVERSTAGIEL